MLESNINHNSSFSGGAGADDLRTNYQEAAESEHVTRLQFHRQLRQSQCFELIKQEEGFDLHGFCRTIWDGALCWEKVRADTNSSQPCPDYVQGFNIEETASKWCTPDGNWYIHPTTNNTWTDYSSCIPYAPDPNNSSSSLYYTEWVPVIKKISQVGYGVSFVTLLLAFFILVSIKKLRCPRNTLHMHLFLSFMLRAFMALLKDVLFREGIGLSTSVVEQNESLIFKHNQPNWECKLFISFWQYFIVANYTWILMEGLYLHNLIFLAPFSDSSAITLYVILGWGCPFIVVGSWALARAALHDTLCWTTNEVEELYLIIKIPIIISIVLNFLFFLNIVRVLLLKLQSAVSIETRKYRYRKWAKSTLVLVPLFGVHYMLLLWMSSYKDNVIETIWLFSDQLFGSFQGFFVAILYCLINGEVRSEMNKKWNRWRTDSESKNIWVPLNQISSKFYHRSTHDDLLGQRLDDTQNENQNNRNEFFEKNGNNSSCCGARSKTSHNRYNNRCHSYGPTSPTNLTQIEEHHLTLTTNLTTEILDETERISSNPKSKENNSEISSPDSDAHAAGDFVTNSKNSNVET